MATNSVAVGLGELRVSQAVEDVLVAYGLGSCVGVGMYDPVARVAGLLHAVLPERTNGADRLSPKYVDSGIAALLAELERAGAHRWRLVVRMAGGANMLQAASAALNMNIGDRNVASARRTLAALGLRLAAEEVGGTVGRTVRLYVPGGRMTVRALGNPERDMGSGAPTRGIQSNGGD